MDNMFRDFVKWDMQHSHFPVSGDRRLGFGPIRLRLFVVVRREGKFSRSPEGIRRTLNEPDAGMMTGCLIFRGNDLANKLLNQICHLKWKFPQPLPNIAPIVVIR